MKRFQKTIWDFYNKNKRDELPWRPALKNGSQEINPYLIYVSEIMLQQTQVDRVVPFFKNWIKQFPTIKKLAEASQVDILRAWKGLGYNSRALRMKKTAELVVANYKGKFPKQYDEILKLPGIGPYTAGAICAFAYNQPIVMIETNIRRVFIHEFFEHPWPSATPSKRGGLVHDRDLLPLIEKTVDKTNPREWYWALMDYGSYLGKTIPNPNKKSRHYSVQKKFKGSDREIRGTILGILLEHKKMSLEKTFEQLNSLSQDQERVEAILDGLEKEGFIEIKKGVINLKK